ncbi:MAG: hypothetical protein K8R48_08445 [Alphaproteobacteria bacterium]|nr:hypothetical protein [Alphaproteobacteria bacterium]
MTLFGNQTPDYDAYRPQSMPEVEYIRRSTREPSKRIRTLLEDWFSRYPENDKNRLRGDLLSSRYFQHSSAYFELFLHELLLRDGWIIQIHPQIAGTTRVPDFLCEREGASIYVEAKLSMGWSTEESMAIVRLETVLETINRRVKSNRYYLGVSTEGLPTTDVSGRSLCERLQSWLNGLNHAAGLENISRGRSEEISFSEAGCRFTFHAYPHPRAEQEHERIIGSTTYGHEGGFIESHTDVRKAVENKANAYGDLDIPYVVAINVHDVFFDIGDDTLSALYGMECVRERLHDDGTVTVTNERVLDGVFGHPDRPRKKNVSGVLVFNNVTAEAIANRQGLYVPNLFANRPANQIFKSLPTVRYENDMFVPVAGQSLTEILGLPAHWPLHGLSEFT